GTRRLKLFYAAQASADNATRPAAVKFILFVNQPKLLGDTYARYLERRVRAISPFAGLPILFSCRARSESEERTAARPRSTPK
ncbi:MAG TPA: hypothetical protein VGH00_04785, partial [Chthoniobacterales bacterium]